MKAFFKHLYLIFIFRLCYDKKGNFLLFLFQLISAFFVFITFFITIFYSLEYISDHTKSIDELKKAEGVLYDVEKIVHERIFRIFRKRTYIIWHYKMIDDNKNHKTFIVREDKSYAKNLIGQKVIIHYVPSVFYPEIRQLESNGYIYERYSVRDDYENLKYVFAFFIFFTSIFYMLNIKGKYPNNYELPQIRHSIRLKTFNKYFLILLMWFVFIIAAFKYSDEIIIMYFLTILNLIITLIFELKFNIIRLNFYDDFLEFECGFWLFKIKSIKSFDLKNLIITTKYLKFKINKDDLNDEDLKVFQDFCQNLISKNSK
ncbi:putative membrane protein [Campylobacter sp. RM5004]|uniref:hypothetical protein n=1 Tax=Campylobacter sp. RM5004 TaxID=1660078 RepID=UPI001EFC2707|nr:hypothetical protein [Campylobacter sp. RM5004]ULO01730.1 putative membrane protein [Campylobacter sp. RM5004]